MSIITSYHVPPISADELREVAQALVLRVQFMDANPRQFSTVEIRAAVSALDLFSRLDAMAHSDG